MEQSGKRPVVLIVEDNIDDEALTLRGLRGYIREQECFVARDGAEAVAFLSGSDGREEGPRPLPDLVLLDLKLPKLSGIDVLKQIRSNPHTACIPVVVLTSSDEERDISDCFRYGANSYVCKPIDYTKFIEVVGAIGSYWLTASILPNGPCAAVARQEGR